MCFTTLIATIAATLAIPTSISALARNHKKKKEARTKWVNEVISSAYALGRAMRIERLNLLLSELVNYHGGKDLYYSNPIKLLDEISDDIKKSGKSLGLLLDECKPNDIEICSLFRNQVDSVLKDFDICISDFYFLLSIIDNTDPQSIQFLARKSSISEEMYRSVYATISCLSDTIISDIIGLRFVDRTIPNYEEMIDQAVYSFQTGINEKEGTHFSFFHSDSHLKSSSSEVLFEEAENYYDEGQYDQAFIWYRKAAEQGSADAQFRLGKCYENGEGCSRDLEEAFHWFELAAKKGLPIAEYCIGKCYEKGRGCNKDQVRAAYWYSDAANKGYIEAKYELSLCLLSGNGVITDVERGTSLLLESANNNCVNAQIELGIKIINEGRIIVARQHDAATNDVIWHEAWTINPQTIDNALSWFILAAENGSTKALDLCGCVHYLNGDSVNAKKWFEKGANAGSPYSMTMLGIIIDRENRLPGATNLWDISKEALVLYKKAAALGFSVAQERVAFYYCGLFNQTDLIKADDLINKAAEQGYWPAYTTMAIMSYNKFRYSEASTYFHIACQTGSYFALGIVSFSLYRKQQNGLSIARYYFNLIERIKEINALGIVIPTIKNPYGTYSVCDDILKLKWYDNEFIFYYAMLTTLRGITITPGEWYDGESS